MTNHTNDETIFRARLLHSVNGNGKIIISKKMLDEVGLAPGMPIEIVVKKDSITIRPAPGNKRL